MEEVVGGNMSYTLAFLFVDSERPSSMLNKTFFTYKAF